MERVPAPAAADQPDHPTRRLPIAIRIVLIFVTGFAAWVGFFLTNYQPLEWQSSFGVGGDQVKDLGTYDSPQGDTFSAYSVQYREAGQEVDLYFDLRNTGPFPVTIEGVADQLPSYFARRELFVGPVSGLNFYLPFSHGRPFTPFSIPGHGSRTIGMKAYFADCDAADAFGGAEFSSVEIRFRAFGISRTARVVLPFTISVNGVGNCQQ